MTAEELAERMKVEILRDMNAGTVPRAVRTFVELHDYVDANCYGGTEKLWDEMGIGDATDEQAAATRDKLFGLMNEAMEIVDKWLPSLQQAT